ncbi:MAG: hypothetical protein ABS42_00445 [Bdellovibrio sp. SCN 50-8]|nr:MAG: hypothetical protein ABS42_00445 [Bdellovibrio sp. SCN 50-8]
MANLSLASDSDHSHSAHTSAKSQELVLKLNGGKKWDTDAPLRQGMEKIKNLINADLQQIHNRKAVESTYKRISEGVDSQIQYLFQNCKLAPEADAQLHVVLSKIISGSKRMKDGKNLDERRAGAIEVLGALDSYNKYFDHPGWKSIEH